MLGPTHIPRRPPIARLGLLCALVYLPVTLGLTTDLIDAVHGAGGRAPCGCDGGDGCCGASCCAPTAASCCGETEPACCAAAPIEGRVRIDTACTCGLDDVRDRALVAGGDAHVLSIAAKLRPPAPAVRSGRRAGRSRPTRPRDPPDPVPKGLLPA